MIILEHLSKRFNHDLVVDGINLKIAEGEIVGILGPNGAGKTTTLRMLTGVLPPSRGNVVIDGKDMKDYDRDLKKMIGYLPENNPLYEEMTVEEYLLFWCNIKGIEKYHIKKAINLAVKHTAISEVYYKPVSQLSKGFRQRVGLAQVLLNSPQILVLDEPTEGLDPNQRREIKDLILSLGKKRTVVISSHVLSEIEKIATRLVIIHKGKIVADGTPNELGKTFQGKQMIEVEIKGTNIINTLKKVKSIKSVAERSRGYYLVEHDKDHDPRSDIFQTAVKNKWILLTMMKKEADLEDVFSQLTRN